MEKSLAEELRTEVNFQDLSGELTRARVGNKNWDNIASIWFASIIFISAITVVFFPVRLYDNFFFRLFLVAIILVFLLYFLQYIKGEILVFYDKKDNVVFWTRVNRANREILNQIVRFVQEKVQSNP
jgi:hypothetical protein